METSFIQGSRIPEIMAVRIVIGGENDTARLLMNDSKPHLSRVGSSLQQAIADSQRPSTEKRIEVEQKKGWETKVSCMSTSLSSCQTGIALLSCLLYRIHK